MSGIITLITDFGSRDPYVASMKGVILSIAPDVKIVDITHEVSKFNVREGAFILAAVAPYFPEGTVHVGVVDPGVGTARRPITVITRRSIFVGPDNGLLMLAAHREGILKVLEISNPKFMLKHVSPTFHGRDIFAPVAAYIARGVDPNEVGVEVADYIKIPFPQPEIMGRRILGEAVYVDGFGNVVTNIPKEVLREKGVEVGDVISVNLKGRAKLKVKLSRAYGEAPAGETLAVVDSFNLLEIAVNLGSAAKRYGVKVGDKIIVEL